MTRFSGSRLRGPDLAFRGPWHSKGTATDASEYLDVADAGRTGGRWRVISTAHGSAGSLRDQGQGAPCPIDVGQQPVLLTGARLALPLDFTPRQLCPCSPQRGCALLLPASPSYPKSPASISAHDLASARLKCARSTLVSHRRQRDLMLLGPRGAGKATWPPSPPDLTCQRANHRTGVADPSGQPEAVDLQ